MPGWELRIHRVEVQTNNAMDPPMRTVGRYEVWHDDVATGLRGTTAEPKGPGDNTQAGDDYDRRIKAGTYHLETHKGNEYATIGYDPSATQIDGVLKPCIGLSEAETRVRTAILVHPGKNKYLSSVGCINLCTSLATPQDTIDYPGSRRRVIALIEDLMAFLGPKFPTSNEKPIPNATIIIEEVAGV